jgi:hypothetical protein
MLTAERLREVLAYDPETGVLTWRVDRGPGTRRAGKSAGCPKEGYLRIMVDGRHYYAHRLAWLYVNGAWPAAFLDHVNMDGTDNRIANLREATKSENACNKGAHRDNSSGIKGVTRQGSRWQVNITKGGRFMYVGLFKTAEEARAAYAAAALEHHGEFARSE